MNKRYNSIASDVQREAMIHLAMQRAGELARDSFYHGLMPDDLGDADLALFAEEAWERFSRLVTFDYPDYARNLFLRAYRKAYQAYANDLPRGVHPNLHTLAAMLEEEIHEAEGH